MSLNTAFTVNYSAAGLYTINFKITYTDGTINYSHTKIGAHDTANDLAYNRRTIEKLYFGPPYVKDLNEQQHPDIFGTHPPYIPHDFTATKSYLSVAAKGDYVIDYAQSNSTGTIRKPLIVISGFDPEAIEGNDYIGNIYYNDYLPNMNYDYNNNPITAIPLNGTNGLDNADDYDIIYLHWHNGTDYIERNAYLLETLITTINNIKTVYNGVRQQNVIIGTSMGGLVARWALRDMEQNSLVHDTRLFISDDAPHWGANVPVAYQALVQYIAPWKIINKNSLLVPFSITWSDMFPQAVDGLTLFNSPAAKQMLIQRYTLSGETLTADNSMHTSFTNEINNMGWPLNCRNIVLSNGACNGTLTFPDNNTQFLNITGSTGTGWTYFGALWRSLVFSLGGTQAITDILIPNVPVRNFSLSEQFPLALLSTKQSVNFDFGAWAIPATGTSLIFKGDVFVRRKILWTINVNSYILKCHVNSSSEMLPVDNAPGGKYDVSLFGLNPDDINAQLHAKLGDWVNLKTNQEQFCFVPTVSALALTNQFTNLKNLACNNIPCLLPTQVKNYYASQQNEIHVSYTTDNSNWILQQEAANVNCTALCLSNFSISGDNIFCTTSTNYTIPNLPAGATVTWSVTPSGVATPNSPNAAQTTITKTANGIITLKAVISNGCGQTITLTKPNITVDPPTIGGTFTNTFDGSSHLLGYYPAVTNDACTGYTINTNMQITGASSVTWTKVSSSNVVNYTQNGNDISFYLFGNNQNVLFKLDASNGCGTTTNQFKWLSGDCGGGGGGCNNFVVSPNPATNSMNVIVPDIPPPCDGINSKNSKAFITQRRITQIKIYDNLGNLKKIQKENKTKKVTISLTGFKPGVYSIEITDGNYKERQQLIIQK